MRSYTQAEICLLLLYALPGQPLRESLYRKLFRSFQALGEENPNSDAELDAQELRHLGCSPQEARDILYRLNQEKTLEQYLRNLDKKGIFVLTRISPDYPGRLREKLGDRAPLILYCAGNPKLFSTRCVSLVGSRQLREKGMAFSSTAGEQIARQGYTYCSGGAAGADTAGFRSAMKAGGSAVLFLADDLEGNCKKECYRKYLGAGRLLLVSEFGSHQSFTPQRALSRNRLIHAMGEKTLVAQSAYGSGGTWSGTMENLRQGWSPVLVCNEEPKDAGTKGLIERGGTPVSRLELQRLDQLGDLQTSL